MPQFEELSKEERDIVLDRLQKEVADVPITRSHAVQGVNQVAKAVVRGELRVVIFATNPESRVFGHLPLLCRLYHVPICVLHLSSKTFGGLFQLKSMVAIGIRSPQSSEKMIATGSNTASTTTSTTYDMTMKISEQLTETESKKLLSTIAFLISKASKLLM